MLMPSIFGENLFDDFFNDFPFYDDKAGQKIEKKLYGRAYMGTFRTTFLINEEGIIERIITPKEVKTKEHASQILNQ